MCFASIARRCCWMGSRCERLESGMARYLSLHGVQSSVRSVGRGALVRRRSRRRQGAGDSAVVQQCVHVRCIISGQLCMRLLPVRWAARAYDHAVVSVAGADVRTSRAPCKVSISVDSALSACSAGWAQHKRGLPVSFGAGGVTHRTVCERITRPPQSPPQTRPAQC